MGRAGRRFYRNTIIGILAMATLVLGATHQFDIAPREIIELFLSTLLLAVLVIVAAAAVVLLWMGLRRLLRHKMR